MDNSKTQIIGTLGPSSNTKNVIKEMIDSGMDVVRLNFSWGTQEEHVGFIKEVKDIAKEIGKKIPIIQDISGPRKIESIGHHFDKNLPIITEKDRKDLEFVAPYKPEYVAMSYVGTSVDVENLRKFLDDLGSSSKIIAKIERKEAVDNIDKILEVADAIMVARGDLSNEVGDREMLYIQDKLVTVANSKKKPVIVATGLLLSMMKEDKPSTYDIFDIMNAIITKADALMLSNETAIGEFPVESIQAMEKIILEAEDQVGTGKMNEL